MKYNVFMFLKIAFIFCSLTVFLPWVWCYAAQVPETRGRIRSEPQALSGHGENFEVVLKYSPFKPGTDVPLVAYILDIATNEPIKGAVLSGSLSSGNESVSVEFKETKNDLPGAYRGTVRVQTDKPNSWLFDISLGEKSDLVAIDGFKADKDSQFLSHQTASEYKETGFVITLTPVRIVLLIAVFIGFQMAVIYFVRRRSVSGRSMKELR
ncbi:MAG: hypothetical protein C0403_09165 [Desulfobacterium sp.]|nr:hypothetical protein [Desulfobacterium sp.]